MQKNVRAAHEKAARAPTRRLRVCAARTRTYFRYNAGLLRCLLCPAVGGGTNGFATVAQNHARLLRLPRLDLLRCRLKEGRTLISNLCAPGSAVRLAFRTTGLSRPVSCEEIHSMSSRLQSCGNQIVPRMGFTTNVRIQSRPYPALCAA